MHTHSIENDHTTKKVCTINSIKKYWPSVNLFKRLFQLKQKKRNGFFIPKAAPFLLPDIFQRLSSEFMPRGTLDFIFLLLFQSLQWHRSGKRLFTLSFACSSYWTGWFARENVLFLFRFWLAVCFPASFFVFAR